LRLVQQSLLLHIKSNYFQNAQKKHERFLNDFEALARERRFRAQVLQNRPQPHSGARISISRTTMRSRNVILKVVSSKRIFEEREKVNMATYFY
jgi:hypothetical protein